MKILMVPESGREAPRRPSSESYPEFDMPFAMSIAEGSHWAMATIEPGSRNNSHSSAQLPQLPAELLQGQLKDGQKSSSYKTLLTVLSTSEDLQYSEEGFPFRG